MKTDTAELDRLLAMLAETETPLPPGAKERIWARIKARLKGES